MIEDIGKMIKKVRKKLKKSTISRLKGYLDDIEDWGQDILMFSRNTHVRKSYQEKKTKPGKITIKRSGSLSTISKRNPKALHGHYSGFGSNTDLSATTDGRHYEHSMWQVDSKAKLAPLEENIFKINSQSLRVKVSQDTCEGNHIQDDMCDDRIGQNKYTTIPCKSGLLFPPTVKQGSGSLKSIERYIAKDMLTILPPSALTGHPMIHPFVDTLQHVGERGSILITSSLCVLMHMECPGDQPENILLEIFGAVLDCPPFVLTMTSDTLQGRMIESYTTTLAQNVIQTIRKFTDEAVSSISGTVVPDDFQEPRVFHKKLQVLLKKSQRFCNPFSLLMDDDKTYNVSRACLIAMGVTQTILDTHEPMEISFGSKEDIQQHFEKMNTKCISRLEERWKDRDLRKYVGEKTRATQSKTTGVVYPDLPSYSNQFEKPFEANSPKLTSTSCRAEVMLTSETTSQFRTSTPSIAPGHVPPSVLTLTTIKPARSTSSSRSEAARPDRKPVQSSTTTPTMNTTTSVSTSASALLRISTATRSTRPPSPKIMSTIKATTTHTPSTVSKSTPSTTTVLTPSIAQSTFTPFLTNTTPSAKDTTSRIDETQLIFRLEKLTSMSTYSNDTSPAPITTATTTAPLFITSTSTAASLSVSTTSGILTTAATTMQTPTSVSVPLLTKTPEAAPLSSLTSSEAMGTSSSALASASTSATSTDIDSLSSTSIAKTANKSASFSLRASQSIIPTDSSSSTSRSGSRLTSVPTTATSLPTPTESISTTRGTLTSATFTTAFSSMSESESTSASTHKLTTKCYAKDTSTFTSTHRSVPTSLPQVSTSASSSTMTKHAIVGTSNASCTSSNRSTMDRPSTAKTRTSIAKVKTRHGSSNIISLPALKQTGETVLCEEQKRTEDEKPKPGSVRNLINKFSKHLP